jgi:hypothetical protein
MLSIVNENVNHVTLFYAGSRGKGDPPRKGFVEIETVSEKNSGF